MQSDRSHAQGDTGESASIRGPGVNYSENPLPFGEMHTENVTSFELIRAAIVAQLAKPAIPVSSFRQLTSVFKGQFLTWMGIVGGAITLFTNLGGGGVINLADWARQLVLHWHEWMATFWTWALSWTGIQIPRIITPTLSFLLFVVLLVIGIDFNTDDGYTNAGITPRPRRRCF